MTIRFNKFIIGMNHGTSLTTGKVLMTYFTFSERGMALPVQVKSPSEARMIDSMEIAKNHMKVFEMLDTSYKGKLSVVTVKCEF